MTTIFASVGYTLRTRGVLMQRSGSSGKHRRNWMVVVALGCALLPAGAGPAHAQDEPDNPLHTASRVELDVVKAVLAQEKAWNAGDIPAYVKGYKDSPDTLFIGKQVSRGFAQILQDYQRNYPDRSAMGTLTFSELEVHPVDDTIAVCIGKYHLDRTKKDGGPADGLFSLVLEKTNDGWKIVLDHTT
jgi:ketosteroid isomerase-like protein